MFQISFTRMVTCGLFSTLCAAPLRSQCHTWDGGLSQGNQFGGTVYALASFDDGSGPMLWAGGDCASQSSFMITRWNGRSWVYTPSLNDIVWSLCVHDDGTGPSIYAGGYFSLKWPFQRLIARWEGSSWVHVGGGLNGNNFVSVYAMCSYDVGSGAELFVGGTFDGAGTLNSKAIIRWNGSTWSALGSGIGPTETNNPAVYALQGFDDGSGPAVFVGGVFGSAGGAPVHGVAKWDGSQWSAAGDGANGVYEFAVFDDGTGPALYATGSFLTAGSNIARWDGTNWVGISNPLLIPSPRLLAFDDGDGPALFAAGSFVPGYPPNIAKWDGSNWTALGQGVGHHCKALGAFDEGRGHGPELFVGGQFQQVGGGIDAPGIVKWTSCVAPIESICPGDHTLASCPCGNLGQSSHGCNNSIATGGALLSPSGGTVPDTLVLTSAGEVPTALSIFLQGTSTTQLVAPFGDGLRCIGGQLLRLYVKNASNGTAQAPQGADPSISARSASLGDPIPPGALRYYQTYYRDSNMSFCPSGGTFNVSNGLRVVW